MKFGEILGEYTYVCMFWGEGSWLPTEFQWVSVIQKIVKNQILRDSIHMKVLIGASIEIESRLVVS